MRTTIRQEIVGFVNAAFKAAYPAVPIVYENQPFDLNSAPDVYVELEVKVYAGHQISLGSKKTRYSGFIYTTVYTKEGKGTVESLQILDWLANKIGYANLGVTQVQAPSPEEGPQLKSWHTEEMKFAFFADTP